MGIPLQNSSGGFTPCPEFKGRAVCVDVTDLRPFQSEKWGETMKFDLAFEVDLPQDNGHPFVVNSPLFTQKIGPKSMLRRFINSMFGREITEAEADTLDTDKLIGMPVMIEVDHTGGTNKKGEKVIYANIATLRINGVDAGWKIGPHDPAKGEPLKPSGHYKRPEFKGGESKEGVQHTGGGAASSKEEKSVTDIVVHIGNCDKMPFESLSPQQVVKLHDNWLPTLAGNKKSADDKRLEAALLFSVNEAADALIEEIGPEQLAAQFPQTAERMKKADVAGSTAENSPY